MMIKFIKQLFGLKKPVPDIEEIIEGHLLELGSCTAKIVVMSPEYGDQYYRCEVVADTTKLTSWAEHKAQTTLSVCEVQQAARLALPLWLKKADLSNKAPSYISSDVVGVLRPYLKDLITLEIAVVVCPICQSVVENIKMQKLNERRAKPSWSWWTDEWFCHHDHLLYKEDHELHFSFREQSTK